MDMGHMPSDGPKCSMNMLFTWDTTNLCIIFRQWRVYSTFSLLMSLIGVVILTAGYELKRHIWKEEAKDAVLEADDDNVRERSSLLRSGKNAGEAEKKQKLIRAAFYAVQVFYSFFIM
ncbi:MAG: hypothetical protein Q9170_006346 [Blastenia crenularia]